MSRRRIASFALVAALILGAAAWRFSDSEGSSGVAPRAESVRQAAQAQRPIEPTPDTPAYPASRLAALRRDPAQLKDPAAWRAEFAAADTPALKAEVLGLAREIGPDSLLAVLEAAIRSGDPLLQLEAARSIFLLPEDRLREGVVAAVAAADPKTGREIVEGIAQLQPHLQPALVAAAIQVGSPEVLKLSLSLAVDRPSPEMFDALLVGLRAPDAETKSLFQGAISHLVDRHFENYEEAERWWADHRGSYDGMLLRSN